MSVHLEFNAEGCYHALIERLSDIADNIMMQFYSEALMGLDAEGKSDTERVKAVWDETEQKIHAECKFYADAIMQSFGTGSMSDTSSRSYWDEYREMRNGSPAYFNPARPGTEIVGRPRGSYRDIYNKLHHTWGTRKGMNIEGLEWVDKFGNVVKIEPKSPTYSIQNAEEWLIRNHERRVEKKIKDEVNKFLSEECGKFFVEVGG